MYSKLPMLFVPSDLSEEQIDEFIKNTLDQRMQDDGDTLTFYKESDLPLCLPSP